jgi:glycosyltransferase involved in cell wall biosynthesis
MKADRPVILLLGPSRDAVSGVTTHVNLLLGSGLSREFVLRHFQVGSEGRAESRGRRLLRLLASPFQLAARIRRERAGVVHINTSFNHRAYLRDLAYLLAAKLCGARVLYQVHGGPLPKRFAIGGRLGKALLRATLSLPDVVVVLTDMHLAAYRKFVPSQAVLAVPNGVDYALYSGIARTPADETAPLRMISVARLARVKGLFEALHGLAAARAQGTAATLTIAGTGPEEARLKKLAKWLGLGDAVHFAGPVFGAAKRALFAQADVLLFPSHSEALPYALLECMAAGIPAIVTPVGGIPEVMVDGVHGVFVPPRDDAAIARAIARMARDRASLAAMSENCRRRIVHSYSVERLTEGFGHIYSALGVQQPADALDEGQ